MFPWQLKSKWLSSIVELEVSNTHESTKMAIHSLFNFCKGFLDKVDPSKITEFEKKFLDHVRGTQRPLLDQIAKDGHLSPASDQALNKVVKDFLATQ